MMWRNLLIISMVFVFSMMLLSPSSWADQEFEEDEGFIPCEQVALEGTWSGRLGAKDEFGNHLCWETCSNLTVDATGVIASGGTYMDCSKVTSDVTGGELTISSGCVIGGYIETSNGTVYIGTGAMVGNELVLGRAEE